MSAAPAKPSLNALLERFGGVVRRLSEVEASGAPSVQGAGAGGGTGLATGLEPLDRALAEGGLPLGVSVLGSPKAVGGASEVAARTLARLQRERPCLVGWVDPSRSLFAPGLERRGIDLARLVVLRPHGENRAMGALELVSSGVFAAVVVDLEDPWGSEETAEPPASLAARPSPQSVASDRKLGLPSEESSACFERGRPTIAGAPQLFGEGLAREPEARAALRRALAQEERFLRRLGEASKRSGCAVLVLTDSTRRRQAPLPAALRLTCTMPSLHTLLVHIDHDRRGTRPARVTVPLTLGPGVGRARPSPKSVASDRRLGGPSEEYSTYVERGRTPSFADGFAVRRDGSPTISGAQQLFDEGLATRALARASAH
jgi:hypothetical protein